VYDTFTRTSFNSTENPMSFAPSASVIFAVKVLAFVHLDDDRLSCVIETADFDWCAN